ncbi:MAG: galactose oxidase [Acidobacteria bacterium]|nr:galactose oxidase [Acidobacteriota bacterium]
MTAASSPKRLSHRLRRFAALSLTALVALNIGCSSSGSNSGGTGSTNGTPPVPPAAVKGWAWVGGSNVRSGATSSVFGTEGAPSTANIPGGRDSSVSWTDSSGNLWLFGGGRIDPLGANGPRNDLWEFDPTSKEWTWVSGSSTVPGNKMGVYGTEGSAAAANVPGGRTGSSSWIDSSNNLWLFGGAGFDSAGSDGALNDLWEFNPSTKQWTWISGSNTVNAASVFGTLGVPAAANVPGARNSAVSWTDHSGNFWLMGGAGADNSGTTGSLNDLWEFNPSTRQWTWISGSDKANAAGVYGTVATAAATNTPGARQRALSWTDSSGNFWLFGGLGYDSTGSENDLNDLWQYSPSTKQWTWISGSSAVTGVTPGATCLPGVYGTQGTAAAANVPGGRNAASAWIDASNNLWLFGGLGCDSSGTQGSLNDLWEFSAATRTWTWQTGSNSVGAPHGGTGGQPGIYGTEGTAAAANTPGGRDGAFSWTDPSGTLWLFGGSGLDSADAQGLLNDLWSYTPQ